MTSLTWLIPIALVLGGVGLAAFLWALKSGQFEDLDGAAYRALEDELPREAAQQPAPGEDEPPSGPGDPRDG